MPNVDGVCRYATFPDTQFNRAKQTSRAEYEHITQVLGLTFLLNWEWQKGSWLEGAAGGARDGAEARRQADAIGYPADAICVQSVDTDALPSQYPIAAEYQASFNRLYGRGPQGAYGEGALLDFLLDRKLIRVAWQTLAVGWGGVSARAQLVQTSNFGTYDVNVPRGGWWGAANTCISGGRCVSQRP